MIYRWTTFQKLYLTRMKSGQFGRTRWHESNDHVTLHSQRQSGQITEPKIYATKGLKDLHFCACKYRKTIGGIDRLLNEFLMHYRKLCLHDKNILIFMSIR